MYQLQAIVNTGHYCLKQPTTKDLFNEVNFTGKEVILDCKLNMYPKFIYPVILFVGLKTLGAFIEF